MISLRLDTKKCMAELLLHDTFDTLYFIEGEITTFNRFTIDGYLHKAFYEEAPDTAYSTWDKLRDYCFSLIKGKRTPLDFKFIFSLSESDIAHLIFEKSLDFQPEAVQGLYLNFRFDGSVLTCTTGTSLNVFTLDKSLEHAFDQWAREFFTSHAISWDE